MIHAKLVSILLQLVVLMSPGYGRSRDAHQIVEATVDTVEDDAAAALAGDTHYAPVTSSYAEDAALQVFWAVRESALNLKAEGDCTNRIARTGCTSFGAWQQKYGNGTGSAWQQARAWRNLLLRGRQRCPAAPAAIMWGDCLVPTIEGPSSRQMALRRGERARELLSAILAPPDAAP